MSQTPDALRWEAYQTRLVALLERLTADWAAIDASEGVGLYLLCGAGLVEVRFSGRAWTSQSALDFEATAWGVWIDVERKSILPDEIRHAVPAWAGLAVAVQLNLPVQARLTAHGETCKQELRAVGPALFLGYVCSHPIRGRVTVRLLGNEGPAPGAVKTDTMSGEMVKALQGIEASMRSPLTVTVGNWPEAFNPNVAQAQSTTVEDIVSTRAKAGEAPAEPAFLFARDGDGWLIRAFGEQGHFADAQGLNHIARLLASPGKAVPLTELVGEEPRRENARPSHFAEPLLDDDALNDIRQKIAAYDADIERAESDMDVTLAEILRREREQLLSQVNRAMRPGGRPKAFQSESSKLVDRVRKALSRVYDTLRKGGMPKTAAHFESAIERNGGGMVYHPAPNPPSWSLRF